MYPGLLPEVDYIYIWWIVLQGSLQQASLQLWWRMKENDACLPHASRWASFRQLIINIRYLEEKGNSKVDFVKHLNEKHPYRRQKSTPNIFLPTSLHSLSVNYSYSLSEKNSIERWFDIIYIKLNWKIIYLKSFRNESF